MYKVQVFHVKHTYIQDISIRDIYHNILYQTKIKVKIVWQIKNTQYKTPSENSYCFTLGVNNLIYITFVQGNQYQEVT